MKLKVRSNSKLQCDLIEVAMLFAASNLTTSSDLQKAHEICSALRAGLYGVAKKLCDDFARPEYGAPDAYFQRKQFVSLLTKVPFAGSNKTRRDNATKAFMAAEARCKRTNRRLKHYFDHPNRMPELVRVALSRAKEYVRQVLGRFDDRRLEELIELSYPGSGVAIGSHNRFRLSLPFKLGDTDLAVTPRALPYARLLVESSPGWCQLHADLTKDGEGYCVEYVIAQSNRYTFVPKDARTMRTIAIEPALNVFLQLGVHSYMARRLEAFGNSINTQERNQNMAAAASVRTFGSSFATLDLAQASDTVSTELVKYLLPPAWFGYLDDLRCHSGVLQGHLLHGEKFSSMGNGYTFALETLIFQAISKACISLCDDTGVLQCSTFGDDIIVPDGASLLVTEVLQFCGFVINTDKSFYLGSFRESCGADWHSGLRVTPQYIKKAVLRPTDVYLLLNRGDPLFNWGPVREYLLRKHSEVEPVLFGLESEDGSACLFTTFDYLRGIKQMRYHPGWQTWTFRGWGFKPELESVPPVMGLVAALFGARTPDSRYSLRGRGSFRLITLTPGVTRGVPRFAA